MADGDVDGRATDEIDAIEAHRIGDMPRNLALPLQACLSAGMHPWGNVRHLVCEKRVCGCCTRLCARAKVNLGSVHFSGIWGPLQTMDTYLWDSIR